MIVWLLVPVAILVLLVILLIVVTSRGTLYLGSGSSISGGSVPLRYISLEQYGAAVSALIRAEALDFLWVTIVNDEMRGMTLYETDGRVELTVNFLTTAD